MKQPSDMTPEERVEEAAALIAAGILRTRVRKIAKNDDNSVDLSPKRRMYVDTLEAIKNE